ncbi:MAG: hypothetical protein ACRD0H_12055, partial [Actinomycetes bacterium]
MSVVWQAGELALVDDLAPASWVIEGTKGFAHNVGSLVPTDFAAYARVLHPAFRRTNDPDWERHPRVPWAEVAKANGRVMHPEVQFGSLVGWLWPNGHEQPPIWDGGPEVGSLPEDLAGPLAEVLGRHTATPGRCWFALWHGWADFPFSPSKAPTFNLPWRDYFLLVGPVSAAVQSLSGPLLSAVMFRSANLWWPDDRSWCVATEVDMDCTYVGGSAECVADLLA